MKLHWSPRSPFVRKVMIAAHELGLADRIACVRSVAAMGVPNTAIMADNPLSKIPALVLADGRVLIDSTVIVEYLDALGGSRLGLAGDGRWSVLSRQALADGLLDALILWRNERDKPEPRQTAEWLAAFSAKVKATLDRLEADARELERDTFDADHIAVGCALSYVDFRFADIAWRTGRPRLAAWHQTFSTRPSVRATEPVDA